MCARERRRGLKNDPTRALDGENATECIDLAWQPGNEGAAVESVPERLAVGVEVENVDVDIGKTSGPHQLGT